MNSLKILHRKDRVDFEIKTQTGRKLSFDSRCRLLPAWLPWLEQFWPPLHWSLSESYKASALWCQCSIWDFRVSFSQQEPFLLQALSRVSYVGAITSGSSLGSVSVASVSTCLDYVHSHLMCLPDRTTLEFSLLPFPGRVRTGVLAFPRLTYWRFLRPYTNLWEVTYEIKQEQFSVHPPTHPTLVFYYLFRQLHGNQHLIAAFSFLFSRWPGTPHQIIAVRKGRRGRSRANIGHCIGLHAAAALLGLHCQHLQHRGRSTSAGL